MACNSDCMGFPVEKATLESLLKDFQNKDIFWACISENQL